MMRIKKTDVMKIAKAKNTLERFGTLFLSQLKNSKAR